MAMQVYVTLLKFPSLLQSIQKSIQNIYIGFYLASCGKWLTAYPHCVQGFVSLQVLSPLYGCQENFPYL